MDLYFYFKVAVIISHYLNTSKVQVKSSYESSQINIQINDAYKAIYKCTLCINFEKSEQIKKPISACQVLAFIWLRLLISL